MKLDNLNRYYFDGSYFFKVSDILDNIEKLREEACNQIFTKDYMGKFVNPKKVIYSEDVTVVIWEDDTKTVVKHSEEDNYSRDTAFAYALVKRLFGSTSKYLEFAQKVIDYNDKPE